MGALRFTISRAEAYEILEKVMAEQVQKDYASLWVFTDAPPKLRIAEITDAYFSFEFDHRPPLTKENT